MPVAVHLHLRLPTTGTTTGTDPQTQTRKPPNTVLKGHFMFDEYTGPDRDQLEADRLAATGWARDVLTDPNALILDTETTGLHNAYVCDLGIIDTRGHVVMAYRLNPRAPIDPGAARVHGITNDAVKDALTWEDVHDRFVDTINGKRVIIYNASFDTRVIRHELRRVHRDHRMVDRIMDTAQWECAMLHAAQWRGEWHDYFGSYSWPRLGELAPAEADHSAVGDCRATLTALRTMADDPRTTE